MSELELTEQRVREGAIELGDRCASSLGPFGGETLVTTADETIVTKDIHRLLDTLEIANPGARLLAASAVEQKERIGDGSLSVIVLGGALLDRAEDLLETGLTRTTIEKGFHRASRVATEAIPEYARSLTDGYDDPAIEGVIRAAFARRLAAEDDVVDAVREASAVVAADRRARNRSGFDDLVFKLNPERGAPPVELIRGTLLKRGPVHPGMETSIDEPRIAVVGGGKKAGTGIEERDLRQSGGRSGKGRTTVTYTPDSPAEIDDFDAYESEGVARQIRALEQSDVDAVFCTMGISDEAKTRLNESGVIAFRRLTSTMARHLARCTGATVSMEVELVEPEMVGTAGHLRVFEADGDTYVRVDGCEDGAGATLLFSSAIDDVSEEVERDVRTAIVSVLGLADGGTVVPGGGGIETRLAAAVRDAAHGTDDRTAIAMEAYADALEDVPRALIRNSGANPIDELPTLRTAGSSAGFDCFAGRIVDTYPTGPLVPARVVRTAVESSTELACQLVRIDGVLTADRSDEPAVDSIDTTPDPERDFKWRRS